MADNFYLLLDLDPAENDWSRIEQRIDERQRRWSSQSTEGPPSVQAEAARKLTLIPDIREALGDETRRKQIAAEAKQAREAREKEGLATLDSLIRLLPAGGAVDPGRVKDLARRVGGGITESVVEARLKAHGRPVAAEDGSRRKEQVRARLDKVTEDDIQRLLEIGGKKDLYDFLGMSRRSSEKSLYATAVQMGKELSRKGTSQATTAARQLAGHCRNLFKESATRERYDKTCSFQAMRQFDGHLEIAGRESRFLSQQQIDELVNQARSKGVAPAVAREYIESEAQKKRFGVEPAGGSPPPAPKPLCGFCYSIAGTDDKRCGECGQELVQPCPNCRTPTPTENRCCGSCGFSTGDAQHVHGLLEAASEHRKGGDFSMAETCLDAARACWKDWPPALSEKKKLDAAGKERESALQKVERLVGTGS